MGTNTKQCCGFADSLPLRFNQNHSTPHNVFLVISAGYWSSAKHCGVVNQKYVQHFLYENGTKLYHTLSVYLFHMQDNALRRFLVRMQSFEISTVLIFSCLVLLIPNNMAPGTDHVSSLQLFFQSRATPPDPWILTEAPAHHSSWVNHTCSALITTTARWWEHVPTFTTCWKKQEPPRQTQTPIQHQNEVQHGEPFSSITGCPGNSCPG